MLSSPTLAQPAEADETTPGFDAFYRHFYVRVLVLMRRHFPGCDAEDVAQETMTRCYTHFGSFEAGRDPWPWIASVARNTAIDSIRRGRRVCSVEDTRSADPATAYDVTYDTALARARRHSLHRAMGRLRPADRQLIEDHDLEGIACADIAAIRDLTPNALRQQLHRARRRLARELRRTGGAFGLAGTALHGRLARAARRVNAVTLAESASTTAFGLIAAATLAGSAVTVLAAPVATAARSTVSPPAATAPAGVRGDAVPAAPRPAPVPVASATPQPRPTIQPHIGPTSLPVAVYQSGDPTKPGPFEVNVTVDTPAGPQHVHYQGENTPGWGVLCYLGLEPC
jgi:RNA polymerase sigma-70 factor (ECF subfamily)